MPERRAWYADGLRFTCTKSAKCCRNHGDYDHVYFTKAEERALARHFGTTLRDLRRRYIRIQDGYRVARARGDGCIFLSDGECSIYDVRPVPCRTWPFWPELLRRAAWERDVLSFCPGAGIGELHSPSEVRRALRLKRSHDRELEADR